MASYPRPILMTSKLRQQVAEFDVSYSDLAKPLQAMTCIIETLRRRTDLTQQTPACIASSVSFVCSYLKPKRLAETPVEKGEVQENSPRNPRLIEHNTNATRANVCCVITKVAAIHVTLATGNEAACTRSQSQSP